MSKRLIFAAPKMNLWVKWSLVGAAGVFAYYFVRAVAVGAI